jgi:hypothetical protein
MIARDAAPIDNRNVYKRIEIGARRKSAPVTYGFTSGRTKADKAEADRIWRHVVQSASGTAAPAPDPSAPDVIDYTLLDSGGFGF